MVVVSNMDQGKINVALKKAFTEDLTIPIIRRRTDLYDEILADIGTAAAAILDASDRGDDRFTAQTVSDVYKHFGCLDQNVRLLDSLVKHSVFYVEKEE